MMNNLDEIFAPTNAVVEPEKKRALEFNPSAKNSKNGTYNAVVRFIPWHMDPSKSVMKKDQIWLKDPISQKGRYIDSPRTVGEQCVVTDLFWNLYNSQNAQLKDFAKSHISISPTYAALVQVITDEQHPELVGKIVPWRFKKSIWDKLFNESHPQMGVAYNPFDIINGRYFSVKVVMKSGWNNYDQCNFFDYRGQNGETSGMLMLNDAGNAYEIVTAQSDRNKVYNYLVSNSPDLSVYDYKPWSSDESAFVQGVVQTISNYANTGSYGQNVAMATSIPTPNIITTPTVGQPVVTMPSANQNVSMPVQNIQAGPTIQMQNQVVPQVNMNESFNNVPTMPTMPTMEMPQPSIMGVDLPDMTVNNSGGPVMNESVPHAPTVVGMGLDSIYNDI